MLVDTVRIKSADWKNKFLFLSIAAFPASMMYKGKAADCDILLRLIEEIKVGKLQIMR